MTPEQWVVYVDYGGDAEDVLSALQDLADRGITVHWHEITQYDLDKLVG